MNANTTGVNNVALGWGALKSNTTGDRNIAIGVLACDVQTTAQYNVGIGNDALGSCTTGSSNTGIGTNVLAALTTGENNTAVGRNALQTNTTAESNTAVGYNALNSATTGSYNTAAGIAAVGKLTTGTFNSGFGRSALQECTTGHKNTAIGNDAGASLTSGQFNVFVGHETGISGSPGGSITTQDDRVIIGSNEITEAHIQVDWSIASDERDKTDVKPIKMGLDFVNKLEPVTYHWDKRAKYVSLEDRKNNTINLNNVVHDGTHKEDWTDIGFLAQAVEKLEEEYGHKISDKSNLTTNKTDDGAYGLTYAKFIPILTKAIQELSAKNEALLTRIEALEG